MALNILSRLRRSTQGNALIFVTMFAVALFGFAALSIDVGHVRYQQRKAQIAADAGALAAAVLLTNSPQSKTDIIAEALAIAGTNGVTSTEITDSAIGEVKVGRWDTNSSPPSLIVDATPYNAVLVPARRTVPMFFAKVVGLTHMAPAVRSVAFIPGGVVAHPYPIAIDDDTLAAVTSYDGTQAITFQLSGFSTGPGQWGAVAFNGENWNGSAWLTAIENGGYSGVAQVGDAVTSSGANQVKTALEEMQAGGVTMWLPVLSTLDFNGPTPVTILSFVGVRVQTLYGTGNNITVNLLLVGAPVTADSPPSSASARKLVE